MKAIFSNIIMGTDIMIALEKGFELSSQSNSFLILVDYDNSE